VHPTGGSRRVFKQVAWLEVGSVKAAFPPPAHPRVTLTVRRLLLKSLMQSSKSRRFFTMQINYAGKISKDDFFKALLLHSMQQYRLYIGIMSVGAILLVLWGVYSIGSPASDETIRYAYFGALILIAAATFPRWVPFLQLSAYNQKGNIYRNNVFGSVNDTGITINSSEINVSFQWSVFDNYRDSKDILILYQGKSYFYWFIPSMFSNLEEWEKFASFAKEKVSINKKSA
jgi:hypothetical protein